MSRETGDLWEQAREKVKENTGRSIEEVLREVPVEKISEGLKQ